MNALRKLFRRKSDPGAKEAKPMLPAGLALATHPSPPKPPIAFESADAKAPPSPRDAPAPRSPVLPDATAAIPSAPIVVNGPRSSFETSQVTWGGIPVSKFDLDDKATEDSKTAEAKAPESPEELKVSVAAVPVIKVDIPTPHSPTYRPRIESLGAEKRSFSESHSSPAAPGAAAAAGPILTPTATARLTAIDWDWQQLLRHKYTVVEKSIVGKGAQGTVKLVHPLDKPDAVYCIKTFHRKTKDMREYITKCRKEHSIATELAGHPNIVGTIDLVLDDATWQVVEVMEFCRDGTLASIMKHTKINTQGEVDCIFVQLLVCLEYMHSHGIAHNDWKLENLVWEPAHKLVKVIDFGLAYRFKTDHGDIKLRKGLAGSRHYLAPEQWTGNPWNPVAVDIWMLAIVYICLCTRGKFPWAASALSEPGYAKWFKKGEFDKEILARLPPSSVPLLTTMLSIDPTKRPSASQLIQDPWVRSLACCAKRAAREAGFEVDKKNYLPRGLFKTGTMMPGAAFPEVSEVAASSGVGGSLPSSPSSPVSPGRAANTADKDKGYPGLTPKKPSLRRLATKVLFSHEHRYS
ncbi:kinase-like protein [Gonapodya prolifera JEL478]|uniref:Kinase-like protein n=1 Tax=Gonapodya prolifera (strain JEL478) TaxID=1344416 RepID=A0A138ZXQ9_GONPJ|nr:kinase-like protein [Gonapodya prolifera JEL478]|eukprot:KXS09249.1 kinase-like protein [Gonapodya prolifera JEL478]